MMCLKSRVRSFLNAPLLLQGKMGQNSTGTLLNRRFFQPGFWFRRSLPNGSAIYKLWKPTRFLASRGLSWKFLWPVVLIAGGIALVLTTLVR
jgi:hypothetical protein